MKRCPYCGATFGKEAIVCPTDGQPLSDPEAVLRLPVCRESGQSAFNAKVVNPLSRAGLYRVFAERSDLIFIRTDGGPGSAVGSLSHFLGPAGFIVPGLLWLASRGKTKAKSHPLDFKSPEELLIEDENNFRLHSAEIRGATTEPPRKIAVWGQAGRLSLTIRHGEKLKIEFDAETEIANAVQTLSLIGIRVEQLDSGDRVEKKSV